MQYNPTLIGKFHITCAGFAKSLRLENACIFLPKGFSERSERRKPGDGRCRERSERQRTAPGETRRTMAKRASVASDFGHRPRVPDAPELTRRASFIDFAFPADSVSEGVWRDSS
jgi:hypothetical protein